MCAGGSKDFEIVLVFAKRELVDRQASELQYARATGIGDGIVTKVGPAKDDRIVAGSTFNQVAATHGINRVITWTSGDVAAIGPSITVSLPAPAK